MLVLLNGEIPVVQEFPQTSRTVELLFSSHIVQLSFFFFNLYFCFMLIGITCWDHILDSLIFCLFVWFTPTCLKRSFFLPHCSHSAMLEKKKTTLKKKKKKKVLEMANSQWAEVFGKQGWPMLNWQPPGTHNLPPPSMAAASAAKVVVCFVFVKLCILCRLYCCKK